MNNQFSILLIEDDKELASLTYDYLTKQGMSVYIESDGNNAVERILNSQVDCVLLDIMLPNKDGFEICKEVRGHPHEYQGPILMLTARDEDIDQLLGLELGADDYVTKPVQPRLLLARINNLVRRMNNIGDKHSPVTQELLRFGNLLIDPCSRRVQLNNSAIELSTAEFDLLLLLAKNAGEILTRDAILKHIRGFGYDGSDRSIDLRISRLRKKLHDEVADDTQRIKTIRGSGYIFATSVEPSL